MNFRVASIIFTIASVVTAGIATSIPISFVVTGCLLEFTAKLK